MPRQNRRERFWTPPVAALRPRTGCPSQRYGWPRAVQPRSALDSRLKVPGCLRSLKLPNIRKPYPAVTHTGAVWSQHQHAEAELLIDLPWQNTSVTFVAGANCADNRMFSVQVH